MQMQCISKLVARQFAYAINPASQRSSCMKTIASRMPSVIEPAVIAQLGKPPKMRENPAFTKVDSAEFHSIFTPELEALVGLFRKHNYELRIAGGAVRDILMNIKPKDIDFATTATPSQMIEMFTQEEVRLINAKGEKHGTITPRINNKENFEVTTLRIDVRTDGRHADVVFTTDWQLDANRRDLTINSMFLGFDGTVYDYFYGYDDLQQRRVIFVGDADVRIKEDYLRILRYFRFYGRIARNSNSHDDATLAAIKANAEGLARISGERIWSELQKIVVGNHSLAIVLEMHKCGLTEYCGLPAHPNVCEFERVCAALEQYPKPHYPILYIISLLNSAEDAIKLHERLKLSAYERDLALFITQKRDRIESDYSSLQACKKLCVQTKINRNYMEQLLKYANKLELYNQFKAWEMPKFPINGNIMRSLGIVGVKTGLVLSELRLIWADSDFKLTSDQLLNTHLPEVMKNVHTPPSTPIKKQRTE